jgi:hypothetical protein
MSESGGREDENGMGRERERERDREKWQQVPLLINSVMPCLQSIKPMLPQVQQGYFPLLSFFFHEEKERDIDEKASNITIFSIIRNEVN